ncbi:hypothetical protein PFNF135_03698 [Plasmodium falciparum NF135/5.C10]|uniref:Uncharacterized protein n=1 Tax=Plasmodium falciparum NF135/5.C10 TaxID=1036726 RepID=W4IGH6_PLAFA|nr:hypothetical protein PFNF135_03698 [Plasmodium falciparum NF135/5.C10]
MSPCKNMSSYQNMSQFRNHLKQYKNTNYKKDNYPLVKISNGIKKKYILNNKRSGNEIYNKAYYSENNTSSELYSNNTSEEKKRNHKDITCGKDLKQSTSHYVDNYNSSKDIKEKRFDKVKTKMNNYVDDNNYIETDDDVDDNKYIHTDDDVDDKQMTMWMIINIYIQMTMWMIISLSIVTIINQYTNVQKRMMKEKPHI